MPGADPQLVKLISHFCQQHIEQQEETDDLLCHMRDAILRCLQRGQVSQKHMAKELGVTVGALHRQLKEEVTSFQPLLDDTRRCLAQRYLLESSLTLTDIATRVGYSELSAFSRAARRWFGASPRTLRRHSPKLDAAA